MGAVKYEDRDECNDESPGSCTSDAFNFAYRSTLNLNTSFTGKDLLYTRLRAGNYGFLPTRSTRAILI